MTIETLVYLHGFLSSPASPKAQAFARAARSRGMRCRIPNLNFASMEDFPDALWREVADLKEGTWALVGSSLGGFYAALMAARVPVRTILVNPAVCPWRHAAPYLGRTVRAADGSDVGVTAAWLEKLRELAPCGLAAPRDVLVMLTTGDEVLDGREALRAFPGSPAYVVSGSDHAVSDIARYIDALFLFLTQGVVPASTARLAETS